MAVRDGNPQGPLDLGIVPGGEQGGREAVAVNRQRKERAREHETEEEEKTGAEGEVHSKIKNGNCKM
jgi:hypothetical protein